MKKLIIFLLMMGISSGVFFGIDYLAERFFDSPCLITSLRNAPEIWAGLNEVHDERMKIGKEVAELEEEVNQFQDEVLSFETINLEQEERFLARISQFRERTHQLDARNKQVLERFDLLQDQNEIKKGGLRWIIMLVFSLIIGNMIIWLLRIILTDEKPADRPSDLSSF